MSEIASEIAASIDRAADAFASLAGVIAYLAAMDHSETAGEQRQLAAVIFHTAAQRFGGVKYDGRVIDAATVEDMDEMWMRVFKMDPGKLKGGR